MKGSRLTFCMARTLEEGKEKGKGRERLASRFVVLLVSKSPQPHHYHPTHSVD